MNEELVGTTEDQLTRLWQKNTSLAVALNKLADRVAELEKPREFQQLVDRVAALETK